MVPTMTISELPSTSLYLEARTRTPKFLFGLQISIKKMLTGILNTKSIRR